MLNPDDCHLLAICDIAADKFETLFNTAIQHSDDEADSEQEEAGEGEYNRI